MAQQIGLQGQRAGRGRRGMIRRPSGGQGAQSRRPPRDERLRTRPQSSVQQSARRCPSWPQYREPVGTGERRGGMPGSDSTQGRDAGPCRTRSRRLRLGRSGRAGRSHPADMGGGGHGVACGQAPEQESVRDFSTFEPGLQQRFRPQPAAFGDGDDGALLVGFSSPDGGPQAFGDALEVIEPKGDQLGAAECAGHAEGEQRAIAHAAQVGAGDAAQEVRGRRGPAAVASRTSAHPDRAARIRLQPAGHRHCPRRQDHPERAAQSRRLAHAWGVDNTR
jgi:hypothetical protein